MNPVNRRVAPPRPPVLAGELAPGAACADEPTVAPPPRAPSRFWPAFRAACGVAVIALASAALAWGARRYVTTSRRFALTRVDVRGSERRTPAALAEETGLALGANVFSLDLDGARARLLADPWIAAADLSRRLPGTVLVRVTERRAAALVALGETFLATAEGEPFKKLELGDPVDLPLVTGLTPDRFAADRDEAESLVRRALDLCVEYGRSPLAKRAPAQEVHVDPAGSFALVVGHAGIRIVVGAPPFRHKLEQAARVIAELDRRRARAGAILLDNEARPERVVVRLR
ncbi:MAG: FtsQ-type POTRA domain-containing protein [Myxococcales bacterium]|nr:FtsQ-type POTRA domain-containing protein [Myxococcales bacterium]